MKLTIVNIVDRGRPEERLHLTATADTNLSFYVVFATAYLSPTSIATTPKFVFWFTNKPVKAGDIIVIYSRAGVASERKNPDGTTSCFYYWGKPTSIWANTGDCAVLLELANWQTTPYQ